MEWNSSAIVFKRIEEWYIRTREDFNKEIETRLNELTIKGGCVKQEDIDTISVLWNESEVEAPSRSLPNYIIFAEKIISREVEIAARAVCFMCNDGNIPERKTSVWKHIFRGNGDYQTVESCRATNIRERLGV